MIVNTTKTRNDFRTPVSDVAYELMNDRFQRIEFLGANITQDQGIIVGCETCPDRVAKPGLLHTGQARHSLVLPSDTRILSIAGLFPLLRTG